MTPRPLTADEAFAIARLRRRPLQTLKRDRAWLPGAPREGPTVSVDLGALERRGLVERWAFGDCWLWRPTDEPPRFDRPHWRCEQELGGDGGLWRVVVNVEPGHPELIASFQIPPRAMGDAYLERDELYEALRVCEREIAHAIELRAAGDACECGSCEAPDLAGSPTIADALASTTLDEAQAFGFSGAPMLPRKFAMVRPDGVVAKVVAVMYGRTVIDAKDGSLIELPEEPAHPVGKGWTYRGGVFYSPAIENGFGAGERQVKAKGSDQ